jgi:hypothetical protein
VIDQQGATKNGSGTVLWEMADMVKVLEDWEKSQAAVA